MRQKRAMKTLGNLLVVLGLAMTACAAAPALADEPDRSLQGDAVVARCHDETESKPVLAIYKTAHGVKADSRTPGCQSCHGPSIAHVKNSTGSSTRPAVDVNFGAVTGTAAARQAETCIVCHQNGQRIHWMG